MREHKFRGKRIDNGEWVYGYYYAIGEYHYIHSVWKMFGESWASNTHLVDAETVGQFTGLKDKNGKEIYEGDIVTGWFDCKKITGWILYGSDASFFIQRKGLYGIGLNNAEDWVEVIGNIYENANLLEVPHD